MLRALTFFSLLGFCGSAMADTLSSSNLPNGAVYGDCVFFEPDGGGVCNSANALTTFGANYLSQLSRITGRDDAALRALMPNAFSDSIYNATWKATCLNDAATNFRDSDGDGRTDGDELGDPCCAFNIGAPPERMTDISNPGLETSVPTQTYDVVCTQNVTTAASSGSVVLGSYLRGGGCSVNVTSPPSRTLRFAWLLLGYVLFVVLRRSRAPRT